jgi:ornithine carbamoyltransferase
MKIRHLISAFDFNSDDLHAIFGIARRIKEKPLAYSGVFSGKAMGLIFEKPSTRTWVSFDVGFSTMGGHAIYLGPGDIKLGVREEVRDVARVLNRYLDLVVMRTFSHKLIVEFARYFKKPVINGLSDLEHPCQAMADFFTMSEIFGDLKSRRFSYIGDGNNVLNSLVVIAAQLGVRLSFASPKKFLPNQAIVERARDVASKTGAKIIQTLRPEKAVQGADIVYTDVWFSMGQSVEAEKRTAFNGYQVNKALLKHAAKDVRVMHCLPAHRGEEIANDVLEGKQSVVFQQAENRLHVQKAILIYLLGMTSKMATVIQ